MKFNLATSRQRIITHLILAVLTFIGCYITSLLKPKLPLHHILAIGFGYVGLLLLVATLLIGPLNTWLGHRRNPVNLNLRRDSGIWVGITGILHVFFGFQVHLGGQIILYFFSSTPTRTGPRYQLLPLSDSFGFSNYTGVAATLVLIVLLLCSNDISLRLLKGKRWKFIQRFNYLLFLLVIAHTLAYQQVVKREQIMTVITFGLVSLTVLLQIVGVFLYRKYRRKRVQSSQPLAPTE